MQSSAADTVIAFGPFCLHCARRLLTRDGMPVGLEGRALDVLIYLATRHGEVVSKHEMIDAVWRGRMVEENNLAVHVSTLRRVLGTTRDGRSTIQTIPRRGYMFLADVFDPADAPLSPPPVPAPPRPGQATALPANAFVGRVEERVTLAVQLREHPLITITAIGGMGKTRLARQVAQDVAAAFPDGIAVADLTTVDDPARALEQVAALFPLGVADRPILDQLAGFLDGRRMLLVLDNCEHLLEPIAALAATVLERCPNVTILATSREPLGVNGERIFRLPPLPVPKVDEAIGAAEALRFDAVRLFVDRAAASVPDFAFDDTVVPAVVEICARLDGLALAIEMAVPRLRVLTPAQLAARLGEGLGLLAAPDRSTAPRHRTLRAMIDWSYTFLPEAERVLFRRLGVFAGTFDLAAVQAVAGEPGRDALEPLAGLVDKSLVAADTAVRPARYSFLQTICHYARERLAESGEHDLRCRHAGYFASVFDSAWDDWPVAPTAGWLPPLAASMDELRAALGWCFGPDGDRELGLRLLGASTPLWWELPNLPLREMRAWFDRAVDSLTPDTPAQVAARIWFGHSWREMRQADTPNLAAAERAVALFRHTDDRTGLGAALWRAGSAALRPETADYAVKLLNEAEQVLRQGAPCKWLTLVLIRQGDLHMRAGENAAALSAYEEAMALARRTHHWYGLTNGGANMADLLFQLDRREEALALLRRLRSVLPLGPRTPLTCTLTSHLAMADLPGEAGEAVTEVVAMAPAIGYRSALARAMETLALLRVEAGDPATAARLAGYAWATMPPATRWGAPRAVFKRLEAALAQSLTPAERDRYTGQGAAWDEVAAAAQARLALDRRFGLAEAASSAQL